MLRRLREFGQIEIGKYPETTSAETLYRHHRIARTLGWIWIPATALMVSSFVEVVLIRDGWPRTIALIALIACAAVTAVTAIPGICSKLWISSIDASLRARDLPIPSEEEQLERKGSGNVLKMLYWLLVLIVAGSLGMLPDSSTSKPLPRPPHRPAEPKIE